MHDNKGSTSIKESGNGRPFDKKVKNRPVRDNYNGRRPEMEATRVYRAILRWGSGKPNWTTKVNIIIASGGLRRPVFAGDKAIKGERIGKT